MLRKAFILILCLSAFLLVSCGGGSNDNSTIHVGNPNFLYVTTTAANVAGFQIAASGALTPVAGSPFTYANADPAGIVATATDVYVANPSQFKFNAFSYTASTGTLNPVVGSPIQEPPLRNRTSGSANLQLCGNTKLFAADSTGFVSDYNLDASTGLPRGSTGQGAFPPGGVGSVGLAVHPSCNFAYFVNPILNVVGGYNFATSALAISADLGASAGGADALTIDPAGKFVLVANGGTNNISVFSIDATTGKLTAVAGSPFPAGTAPSAIATVSTLSGTLVVVANGVDNTVSVFALDSTSGALTQVGTPVATGARPSALTSFGGRVFVANQNSNDISVFTLQTNGTLATVAGSPFSIGASPRQMTVASPPQ
jgi:6-phosphogluconolactonase (cycloisomerase 2 family)